MGFAAFTAIGAGLLCDFRPNPRQIQILVFLRFRPQALSPLGRPRPAPGTRLIDPEHQISLRTELPCGLVLMQPLKV